MPRQIALLRGINVGGRNRIGMAALRAALTGAGFADVTTYLQSGNVVLTTTRPPEATAAACERAIADAFELDIRVLVRTADELDAIVRRNPLAADALEPKRHLVTFLAAAPPPELLATLEALRSEPERLAAAGREIYSWHPDGIGRSRLWERLAGRRLGLPATARNWATVTALAALAR